MNESSKIDAYGEFISARGPEWLSLFQKLIQSPSIFGKEHKVSSHVSKYITAHLGLPVYKVDHSLAKWKKLKGIQHPLSRVSNRNSLVVRLPGTGNGRSLILNTHLDIVPDGDASLWAYPPYSGYIDSERNIIYGRGAMDDKAGVLISLAVLETLVKTRTHLKGDVIFQFVLEDETTGNGSLFCLSEGYTADAAIILDGTRTDKAISQHAGNLQFSVNLRGKPASVSVSHMGVNAAELMGRMLLELRDAVFLLNEEKVPPWDRFPSPFQFVVQSLHSQGELLTVPDFADAECYMTFPPPYTLEKMREFILERVNAFAARHNLPVIPVVNWKVSLEPVSADISRIKNIFENTANELGFSPIDISPSTGTSYLRHFVNAGIPCLLYGPGTGYNPHRADEHYYLDDLPRMILFYLTFINNWCGNEPEIKELS